MSRVSDEERLAQLRLIRTERIGPRTFHGLLARYGNAVDALRALPDLALKSGRAINVASRDDAIRELRTARSLGATFLASGDEAYPEALRVTEGGPALLAVLGNEAILSRPTVAIVGSRNASASGGTFAERLAAGLGEAGFAVASGLARGIDTRAHRASLSTGTIAVLAGGLDRIYPRENEGLLRHIVGQGGAVVSEMPLGWEARGRDFPRRNRIVSGLSLGVVVVEAARRSGSLITARFAGEQGREVFAVPGSPLDLRAEGTNDLIRNGATLCTSVDDVVSALSPLIGEPLQPKGRHWQEAHPMPFDEDGLWDEMDASLASYEADGGEAGNHPASSGRVVVEQLLGAHPVTLDEVVRQSGLGVSTVAGHLSEIELEGRLIRHPGGSVSLVAIR